MAPTRVEHLCEDASILWLPDELAESWPGPRTSSSPAAAKVHARIRATTGELVEVKLTHGRVADCEAFGVRPLRRHRGRGRKAKDMPPRVALAGLERTVFDVACALRNAETGEWHVTVTNVAITALTGELVARTTRLRWEVEQSFKLGKSGSGLRELPSANQDIVRTLIYAALCRATVRMRGRRAVQDLLGGGRANLIHALSWHRVWLLHAHAALRLLLPPPARLALDQLRGRCAEANPSRWRTIASSAEAA